MLTLVVLRIWKTSRQDYFEKRIRSVSAQSINQRDFFRVTLLEAGVKADNGTEYCYRNSGYNNGFCSGPSQTINNGARADLGRLFKITR